MESWLPKCGGEFMSKIEKIITLKEAGNPEISVIIPTLNEEKYLEDTLLSIKWQNINVPYEIIVSDGKSKDRTVEIAKKYADKIVICKRKGISLGRNVGALVAKGKYFVFVDADTLLLPNTLSEVYKEIRKRGVALISVPVMPKNFKASNFFFYFVFNIFSKISTFTKKPQISGIFMCVKAEYFRKIGGFNEELKILEDFDFSERIAKLGKVKIVESTMVLTSPRRIERWGKIKAPLRYVDIYLSYLLTGKDIGAKFYRPVR